MLQDGQSIVTLDQNILNYNVTGLTSETIYEFEVVAVDLTGNVSQPSNTLQIETLVGPDLVLFEDFDNCDAVDSFMAVSEVSDLDWNCVNDNGFNNTGAFQMNSFSGGQVPSLD